MGRQQYDGSDIAPGGHIRSLRFRVGKKKGKKQKGGKFCGRGALEASLSLGTCCGHLKQLNPWAPTAPLVDLAKRYGSPFGAECNLKLGDNFNCGGVLRREMAKEILRTQDVVFRLRKGRTDGRTCRHWVEYSVGREELLELFEEMFKPAGQRFEFARLCFPALKFLHGLCGNKNAVAGSSRVK
nr:hypothetical protein Iba_chr10eCG15840 [Ipomoea batatas]